MYPAPPSRRAPKRSRRRACSPAHHLFRTVGVLAALVVACQPAPIDGRGYQLAFEDHFSGTTLNGYVWTTAPFGGSLPARVADGVLTIKSTKANDWNWGYIASTGPRSKNEPNYPHARAWEEGYFEARIRYTQNPWIRAGFWLYSMAKTEAWPGEDCSQLTSEWDVMQNGNQNADGKHPADRWYWTVLHRNTPDRTENGYCGQPDSLRTFAKEFPNGNLSDWHVWGGHWDNGHLCTYLDGKQVNCTYAYDTTAQPMKLVFSVKPIGTCTGCPPRPSELKLQVDWVRVWQD